MTDHLPKTVVLAEDTDRELAAELHTIAERLHVIARTLDWRAKMRASKPPEASGVV